MLINKLTRLSVCMKHQGPRLLKISHISLLKYVALTIFVLKHRLRLMLSHYTNMHKSVNYVANYLAICHRSSDSSVRSAWRSHLTTRSSHRVWGRHRALLNPNQPHHQPWTRMIQICMVNLNVLLKVYKKSNRNEHIFSSNLAAMIKSSFFAGPSPVNAPPKTPWPLSSCGENEVTELHHELPPWHADGKVGCATGQAMLKCSPLCARGQDTCTAPICSTLRLIAAYFLEHQGDWGFKMKR